ncbi:MAG: Nif3-like dinuclear metal center hexameric protein [Mangrovibacterium sp.]
MKIKEIIDHLEALAPLAFQESYDNAGLLVGAPTDETESALLCLDVTESVVDEAIAQGHRLIISHHPLIFGGLKKINGKNEVERCVIKAIRHQIAIYAAHTNLDAVQGGVNTMICNKIGLVNQQGLTATNDSEPIGIGLVGDLPQGEEEKIFLQRIKDTFHCEAIRHSKLLGKKINRVAVCGGAGSSLAHAAIAAGADIFITGDMKYHEFFEADNRIILADIGHFESEQFTPFIFRELLIEKIPNFVVRLTTHCTNAVNYFI